MARKRVADVRSSGVVTSIRATFDRLDRPDTVAWAALLALVFLVPLATTNFTALGFDYPLTHDQFDVAKVFALRGLTIIAAAAWVWGAMTRGATVRTSPVLIAVVAFIAWVTLSSALSIHVPTAVFGKYRRFEGLVTFFNYAVLFFLMLQYADSSSKVRAVAKTLFLAVGITAIYGSLQSFGFEPSNWGEIKFEARRAFATYGNPDMFGGILALTMPIALSLALGERDSRWRVAYWVGFLLMSYALLASFVRGAWIGAAVGVAIVVIAALIKRSSWHKIDAGFVGATVVAVVAVIVRSLRIDSEVMNVGRRIASIFNFESGSGHSRLEIWKAASAAISDSPIWGHGPDTFRLLFPKYKTVEYMKEVGYRSVADNVHNYPLQLATGVGIVGVTLMYGIFAWVAVVSAKIAFKRESAGSTMVFAGLWAGCAGYLTHLMFGLSLTGSTFFLWVALALLLTPSARIYELKAPRWGAIALGVTAALALVAIVFNVQFVAADHYHLQSVLLSQSDPVKAVEYSRKSVSANPFNDIYWAQEGIIWAQYGSDLAIQGNMGPAVEALGRAERAILNTIEFCPPEYDNYVFLANVYNLRAAVEPGIGYEEKAVEASIQATEVSPHGPSARMQLANAYWVIGERDKALEQLEIAIAQDPNYVAAITRLEDFRKLIAEEETED